MSQHQFCEPRESGSDVRLGTHCLPCPDGDLDAFEGAVPGVLGSDLQGPMSRQRWQIQGGFEVSPAVVPFVGPYDSAYQDLPVRVDQGNGLSGFGVAIVAAYCEGVCDNGVRAWLDEDRVARKDVHDHASLGSTHDIKTLDQPIAEFAIRYARRAGRRQEYAQKAV